MFYSMACCFDAGDCNEPVLSHCSTCSHQNKKWIGDGICDPDLYDFGIDCCWDGGDCHLCRPKLYEHNNWKLVACDDINKYLTVSDAVMSLFFPWLRNDNLNCTTCPTFDIDRGDCTMIGNGVCDQNEFNIRSCFDGGDCGCPRCQQQYSQLGMSMSFPVSSAKPSFFLLQVTGSAIKT